MQDCSNPIANALELLHSCTKLLTYSFKCFNSEIFLHKSIIKWYTVECCYDAVQYCKIFHEWLQKLRQNINLGAGSTKDTPYLGLMGELWGVFCEYLWEYWSCYNGTTLYHLNITSFYVTTLNCSCRVDPIMHHEKEKQWYGLCF